jgi:hypothetical protein
VGVAVSAGVNVNVGAAVDTTGVFVAVAEGIIFPGKLQEVTNRNKTANTIQRSFDIRSSLAGSHP